MKNFNIYYNWLIFSAIMVVLIGFYLSFFNGTSLFVFDKLIDNYFWKNGTIPEEGSLNYIHFFYSLSGALMMAWGSMILFILKNAYKHKMKWAWNSIFYSLILWFPIDEFYSIYHKVYFNAIFNLLFLGIFMIPLFVTKNSMKMNFYL